MKIIFGAGFTQNYSPNMFRQHTQVQQSQQKNENHNISNVLQSQNVVFCAKPDSVMLMSQCDKLCCAYSGKKLLSPYFARSIFAKFDKKTTAQSMINYLNKYEEYMLDTEQEVFDFFKSVKARGKMTFQDILIAERPAALKRLRDKQKLVLNSADSMIEKLSTNTADAVSYIKDLGLIEVDDGTFSRHGVLDKLKDVQADSREKDIINEIYKQWYQLPRSYKDFDAFIVKYSKCSHEEIAQRLLSMSIANVEHVKAYSKGGLDNLWNLVLTCKIFNLDKDNMNLSEYDELNPDIGIQQNLLKYINSVRNEIKSGNEFFETNYLYPSQLGNNIFLETGWKSFKNINVDDRNVVKNSNLPGSHKGSGRYRTNHKLI